MGYLRANTHLIVNESNQVFNVSSVSTTGITCIDINSENYEITCLDEINDYDSGATRYYGKNGKLYSTGSNKYGKLGSGNTNTSTSLTSSSVEVKIIENPKKIMTRDACTCCLQEDGKLYHWGAGTKNFYGEEVSKATPQFVSDGVKDFYLSAKGRHLMSIFIIKEDNSLWANGDYCYSKIWQEDASGNPNNKDDIAKATPRFPMDSPSITDFNLIATDVKRIVYSWEQYDAFGPMVVIEKIDGSFWYSGSNMAGCSTLSRDEYPVIIRGFVKMNLSGIKKCSLGLYYFNEYDFGMQPMFCLLDNGDLLLLRRHGFGKELIASGVKNFRINYGSGGGDLNGFLLKDDGVYTLEATDLVEENGVKFSNLKEIKKSDMMFKSLSGSYSSLIGIAEDNLLFLGKQNTSSGQDRDYTFYQVKKELYTKEEIDFLELEVWNIQDIKDIQQNYFSKIREYGLFRIKNLKIIFMDNIIFDEERYWEAYFKVTFSTIYKNFIENLEIDFNNKELTFSKSDRNYSCFLFYDSLSAKNIILKNGKMSSVYTDYNANFINFVSCENLTLDNLEISYFAQPSSDFYKRSSCIFKELVFGNSLTINNCIFSGLDGFVLGYLNWFSMSSDFNEEQKKYSEKNVFITNSRLPMSPSYQENQSPDTGQQTFKSNVCIDNCFLLIKESCRGCGNSLFCNSPETKIMNSEIYLDKNDILDGENTLYNGAFVFGISYGATYPYDYNITTENKVFFENCKIIANKEKKIRSLINFNTYNGSSNKNIEVYFDKNTEIENIDNILSITLGSYISYRAKMNLHFENGLLQNNMDSFYNSFNDKENISYFDNEGNILINNIEEEDKDENLKKSFARIIRKKEFLFGSKKYVFPLRNAYNFTNPFEKVKKWSKGQLNYKQSGKWMLRPPEDADGNRECYLNLETQRWPTMLPGMYIIQGSWDLRADGLTAPNFDFQGQSTAKIKFKTTKPGLVKATINWGSKMRTGIDYMMFTLSNDETPPKFPSCDKYYTLSDDDITRVETIVEKELSEGECWLHMTLYTSSPTGLDFYTTYTFIKDVTLNGQLFIGNLGSSFEPIVFAPDKDWNLDNTWLKMNGTWNGEKKITEIKKGENNVIQ